MFMKTTDQIIFYQKADDVYEDDRSDYISNEVSLDYNAGFQVINQLVIKYLFEVDRLISSTIYR